MPSRYRARCLLDTAPDALEISVGGHPWQDDARQLAEDSRCIEDTTGITADLHEQRVDPLKPVSYLERLAVCEDWQQHGVSVSTRVRLPDSNIVACRGEQVWCAADPDLLARVHTAKCTYVGARHPSRAST